jgi:hypothetical protein
VHRNAPLTPEGRFRLCQLIDEDGWTIAGVIRVLSDLGYLPYSKEKLPWVVSSS